MSASPQTKAAASTLGVRAAADRGRKVLPGIVLLSQGATPQLSSPLLRFTTEFEMDRSGTTALWTPGYSFCSGEP